MGTLTLAAQLYATYWEKEWSLNSDTGSGFELGECAPVLISFEHNGMSIVDPFALGFERITVKQAAKLYGIDRDSLNRLYRHNFPNGGGAN